MEKGFGEGGDTGGVRGPIGRWSQQFRQGMHILSISQFFLRNYYTNNRMGHNGQFLPSRAFVGLSRQIDHPIQSVDST